MLRNLRISNAWPSRPIRRCRKSTGPGESNLIAIAIAAISGDRTTRAMLDAADVEAALQEPRVSGSSQRS